ncbi:hypothetical protein LC612_26385 [Nostoc sp. CHAB 5834]|nr:hypothetical protein [Nostoc sp. CHAB 5834]
MTFRIIQVTVPLWVLLGSKKSRRFGTMNAMKSYSLGNGKAIACNHPDYFFCLQL